jgi:hypothetical protein
MIIPGIPKITMIFKDSKGDEDKLPENPRSLLTPSIPNHIAKSVMAATKALLIIPVAKKLSDHMVNDSSGDERIRRL